MALDPSIILEASRSMPEFGKDLILAHEVARKRKAEDAATERTNKFSSLLANVPKGMDRTKYLTGQGFGDEALEYGKKEAETAKLQAESNIKGQEYQAKRIETGGKVLQQLAEIPDLSKQVMKQIYDINYKSGILDPQIYQGAIAELSTLPDDRNLLRQHLQGRINALQSAKDQMQYMRPDANAQLSAETQLRGQDISRENNLMDNQYNMMQFGYGQQQDAAKQDFEQQKFSANYNLDQRKQNLEEYKAKNQQGANAISPSQRQADADAVLSILQQAEPLLNESTSSMVGTGVDMAAGALGYGTKGAEKAAQLKALEGALVSKMPKMSGPQSDKDVLLYKQMAGQIGDSTIPISVRKAAIQTIRELNTKYASPQAIESTGGADYKQKHGVTDEEHAAVMKLLGRR